MPDHNIGHYTGRLILEFLSDGQRMRVIEDFGFMEADGVHWPVPPKTTVDGASIPQVLWSVMGGPFEGKYRDASVVHDYYCAVRSADWRSVHRMFYRAMLVSGVSVRRAKVMYAAVYFAGPRWDDLVVDNVLLGQPAVPTRHDLMGSSRLVAHAIDLCRPPNHPFGPFKIRELALQLDYLSDIVERDYPSLDTL